jgi:glutathione peroxidase
MYQRAIPALGLLVCLGGAALGSDNETQSGDKKVSPNEKSSFYDFSVKNIDGSDVALSDYKDRVCLIVNVASR